MSFILDKLERDIKQNVHNLKQAGLGDLELVKKLNDLKKDVKALRKIWS